MRAIVRDYDTYEPGTIIGVTADASAYHIDCAIAIYGSQAIIQVCFDEDSGISDDEIVARVRNDTWALDRERNGIRVVMVGRDDSFIFGDARDDSAPACCDSARCHHGTLAHNLSSEELHRIENRIKLWE